MDYVPGVVQGDCAAVEDGLAMDVMDNLGAMIIMFVSKIKVILFVIMWLFI